MKFRPVDPAGFGLDLDYEKSMREFIYRTKDGIKTVADDRKRAISLQSGGADSTACGIIGYEALGSRFTGIHFEHGFMRKGECQEVLWNLNSECKLPVIYRDLNKEFMSRVIRAGADAEEKRKVISETYFDVALNLAKEFDAEILIHGTIKPDWLETKAGIKRQHNVIPERWQRRFEENDIKIVEPLYHLYKPQVRNILRYFDAPQFITERKPFPGPGLAVRCVGQVTEEKMDILREADAAVTPILENYAKAAKNLDKKQSFKDFQCLCAIMDNRTKEISLDSKYLKDFKNLKLTEDKVTGMVKGKGTYTNMLLIDCPFSNPSPLIEVSDKIVKENLDKGIGRVAALLNKGLGSGEYNLILRSTLTTDFTKAKAAPQSNATIAEIVHTLRSNLDSYNYKIGGIYYDVTNKPPGTIEFE